MDPQHRHVSPEAARAASNPVAVSPVSKTAKLDTPRSLSSAQSQRSIKDLVNRYNQTSANATQDDRPQRHVPRTRLQKPRSPTKPRSSTKSPTKYSQRPNGATISPLKSPTHRPKQQQQQPPKALFGEATHSLAQEPGFGIDHNLAQAPGYALTHNFAREAGFAIPRRHRSGSDGSLSSASGNRPARTHKRSQSNAEYALPNNPPVPRHSRHTPHHRRSRSDHLVPDSVHLNFSIPANPSSSLPRRHSPAAATPDRPSRIPISNSRRSGSVERVSPALSRSASQMGQSPNYFPTSRSTPAKQQQAFSSSPSCLPTPVSRRYDPKAYQRHAPTGQSLKAIIHAPLPQKSPPLRSSRPRQPVSVATTQASRARSGQRFESVFASNESNSAKYRTKKKPPELARVDFAARREKIQRAISQSLKEDPDIDSSVSVPSSSRAASTSISDVNGPPIYRQNVQNGYNHDIDSSFEHVDVEDSDTETPEHAGPLSPITPRNIPGAFVDYDDDDDDDSPLSVKHADISSDPEPSSYLYSESNYGQSPQPNGYPEIASLDQSFLSESCDGSFVEEQATGDSGPATLLSQVMKMRERSVSSDSRTDFDESSSFTPSDNGDQASIHIMLQGDHSSAQQTPASVSEEWSVNPISSSPPAPYSPSDDGFAAENEPPSSPPEIVAPKQSHVPDSDDDGFASDAAQVGLSSPWLGGPDERGLSLGEHEPRTPQKSNLHVVANHMNDDDKTPRQSKRVGRASMLALRGDWNEDTETYGVVNRIANEYKETGSMSPEMLHEFQQHVSTLSPNLSKAEASDADSMSFLLESMLREKASSPQKQRPKSDLLSPNCYNPIDRSNMETPEEDVQGTAIIYSTTYRRSAASLPRASQDLNDSSYMQAFSPSSVMVNTPASQHDSLTPASQYSGANTPALQSDTEAGANDDDDYRPPPPPKDFGYSPRSSTGQNSFKSLTQAIPSARNSRSSDRLQLPEIPTGTGLGLSISGESTNDVPRSQPPLPNHSPPPPPPPSKSGPQLEVVLTDASPAPTYVVSQPPSPVATRQRVSEERFRNFSTPGRPSMEQMKPEMVPLPPSQSMSSFQSSVRPSMDIAPPSTMPPSPNPEHRRLIKRKNIIKELIDTEYSYHQDMKIIEDIYKATVGDLITADDKKALFGNVDQVEAFSLEFYDALRRAVSSLYVPPRSSRWQSKRGSENSDGTQQPNDGPDEDKDRLTRVGEVFQSYVSRMERIYGAYLKNHDIANQRLSKLQTDATVKCWLAECHNNASDITTAWDLDSLLVKPTQRILKYPLLLHQLTESTPENHPDYKALKSALNEIMNVSKRINEAKKRADLVEQIVNRKRGQSDVRNGIARAFGRRTEKLKERVGIAEVYQDPVFDELAHKFGGHFIKLQVCMRDVQGSLTELDKAVDHFLTFATSLEAFIEIGQSTTPEIESKWRKFVLAIRELATVALPDHKNRIQKHVINPMLTCIELHKGPQNAIQKRKKRIVDYARCQTIQERGEKPDKKTLDASEMYEALNEQLKIDLPRLYSLSGDLIKACLDSNVYLQGQWMWLWKEKLAPVIDFVYAQPDEIVPAFAEDFQHVYSHVVELGICNGSMLADAANFLSPQTTLMADDSSSYPSQRRPSILTNGQRTLSTSSEFQPMLTPTDMSKSYGALPSPGLPDNGQPGYYGRMRSSSSLSTRGRTPSVANLNNGLPPPARMPNLTPKSSFSASRPSTAQRPADLKRMASRISLQDSAKRSPSVRPSSAVSAQQQEPRFSGMFSSAMPMSDASSSPGLMSPQHAPEDTHVMFVAASLFEFNIDRARREAGYPYLTYVEGEVFDVVAQKGELWLAKNQDDPTNSLGWIWEQHFVILSQEA